MGLDLDEAAGAAQALGVELHAIRGREGEECPHGLGGEASVGGGDDQRATRREQAPEFREHGHRVHEVLHGNRDQRRIEGAIGPGQARGLDLMSSWVSETAVEDADVRCESSAAFMNAAELAATRA